ncbi:uncharacterized protein LOC142170235 [Nicotiana tabacum]|uniref:Uncharacterized protein LOC142170235 n=1 Tax=Nicotiana tabacum TaxID=4097 RepID=A0AC58ST75_TOBAC
MVYSSNAGVVWGDLKERFDKVNCSRIFQIHREIAYARQGTSSILTHFSKLRVLWAEFNSLAPIPGHDDAKSCEFVQFIELQKFLQFLMGLSESYGQARSQILMMVPVPSVNKSYSMLMECESQKTMASASASLDAGEIAALLTNRVGNQQNLKKNYNLYCDYCKLKGHTRDICYKLVGYPNDHKFKKKYNPQETANMATEQPALATFTPLPPHQTSHQNNTNKSCNCLIKTQLNTPIVHTTAMQTSTQKNQSSIKLGIWHQRLGHLPMEALKIIEKLKQQFGNDRSAIDCLESRALPAVFMGYSHTKKGYKLYDLHSKQFPVSRDVIFKEQIFPFKNMKVSSIAIFPVLEPANAVDVPPIHNASQPIHDKFPDIGEMQNANEMPEEADTLLDVLTPSIGLLKWMQDFVSTSCAYPMTNYLNYDNLSPYYAKCLLTQSSIVEPKHFAEDARDAR